MDLEQLIIDYGYLALFIGTFLEGETILVIAGFLAHSGYLQLPWVISAAFLGTFAGDQTFFYLGRFKGIRFLEKRPLWHSKTDKVFDLLHRHQIKVVLGFRFLYGVRNVTPFVIGASRMHPVKFFILNFLGALIWAIAVGYLGYEFGDIAQSILGEIKQYEIHFLVGLIVIGLLLFWRSTHNARQERNKKNLTES
ncbi:DedA family protein [Methylomonas sp. LL1]|uniref:DedA family protein n=1 Tax=Methylomonas sp. LL1 TaxID=2785785 RepID=UPI0018C38A7D|nr:DedA family protein [Methylomonas sp. LL1]QPK65418.1 DedA family protein [Methylomonas sp. LL1]